MNIKAAALVILAFVLSACSATAPTTQKLDSADATLAEASFSVSRSLVSLAETAQASHPLPNYTNPPSPASYGMGGLASIDWSGPVEPIVRQIAQAANYRLRVLGNAPAIPLLVTVYAKNQMLADILRDVSYQCGRRATILVFASTRVIELRYAKN